ncbi:iron chelate uptake ABC transporter family permease subunit [Klugiella xanthotipulae]|uniref:Iron complex transport system permease protein n=1 Tax=Klugiella xanthotipulae TaxID=244735 RepID=A0A543HZC9_9MICO|nr:iron chelate uptake ABC transporter family permease subunit [Klugiella xanthotipulae]TQM63620.1 iron complex transport system permease protein [Klugiella xanthotipulae]
MTSAHLIRAARHRRGSRELRVVGILTAAVLALAALTLSLGDYGLNPAEVLNTLIGRGDTGSEFVILQLRLPGLTLAVLAGACLALSGALFQTLLGNPLASPDIMGITGGASVAAVYTTLILGLTGVLVSVSAFIGAVVIAGLILLLSRDQNGTGYRFVLTGVGIAFMCTGVIGFLLTRAQARDAQAALVWVVGSIGTARWRDILVLALGLAVLLPLILLLTPRLRVLQLGHLSATGLGVRVTGTRTLVLVVAVALAAVATAAVGPVPFVALCSAPIARRVVGTGALSLAASAGVGAVLMLVANLIAQNIIPTAHVPVGIVTGAVGAPYLLWLLATSSTGAKA